LFDHRDTNWTVLGNQVLMMQVRQKDPAADIVNTDKWDGNAAARTRLLQGAADRKVNGLVAVTGDLHRAVAGNLMVDFDKPGAAPIGAEFVATSVSSDGDGSRKRKAGARLLSNNPHLRFYDGRRGYLTCDFDQSRCEATYKTIDQIHERGGKVSTAQTFTVDAKQPGIA
jgi:alkaline phosphatase D